jgi:hypothetical protein
VAPAIIEIDGCALTQEVFGPVCTSSATGANSSTPSSPTSTPAATA